jgi:ABC-2 type transport system ATP-binding protein
VIKAEKLTKRFGRFTAVDGLDLEVAPGEIFGFLGPNGAGKTTTIRMLTGLLRPTAGRALICGHDVWQEPVRAKMLLGYVPDEPVFYEKLTGWEFLSFVADLYRIEAGAKRKRIAELLHAFGLEKHAVDLLQSYSRGMRQKITVAAALVHEPRVLILDEPLVGLDPPSARTLKDLLRMLADHGVTIFMATHILAIAEELCGQVGIINRGRLIAVGSLEDLRQKAKEAAASLEEIFLQLTSEAADAADSPGKEAAS